MTNQPTACASGPTPTARDGAGLTPPLQADRALIPDNLRDALNLLGQGHLDAMLEDIR